MRINIHFVFTDSPAHQSEMAKMLASVRLNKVDDSDRPARVVDSRSELLQAIRVGKFHIS